jgi:hypothetical protein
MTSNMTSKKSGTASVALHKSKRLTVRNEELRPNGLELFLLVVGEDSKYGGETVNRKGLEEVSRRKSIRVQPFFV